MKNLDKCQLITLEDNKQYVVIDSVVYEDNNFAYIINPTDLEDQLIVMVTKDENGMIVNVLDEENENNKSLIDKLSEMFAMNFFDDLEEV